jgi:iron complex transport system permease protein
MRSLASPDDRRPVAWGDSILLRLIGLTAILVLAAGISIGTGAAAVPIATVLEALFGGADATTRAIVLDLRLPRIILATLVGGGLAVSGAAFQALLRNPLAEPYILGVSGGAAVGAVAATVLGFAAVLPWAVPLAAFTGAMLAIVLVFWIAIRVGRGLDTRVLLLAGVVIGAFFNAVIFLLLTFADVESFRSAVFWMMGSLSSASWATTVLAGAYVVPLTIAIVALARTFNLLALGDETAHYLGVRVERARIAAYIMASLIVAAAVATCGVIGFVGLIVPHALRMQWGSDHRLLLPGSFLAGGAFLLIMDTAARTLAAPAELPVGVITAIVGVPLFVVILVRSLP